MNIREIHRKVKWDGSLRLNCFIAKFSSRHICTMDSNICKIFIPVTLVFFSNIAFLTLDYILTVKKTLVKSKAYWSVRKLLKKERYTYWRSHWLSFHCLKSAYMTSVTTWVSLVNWTVLFTLLFFVIVYRHLCLLGLQYCTWTSLMVSLRILIFLVLNLRSFGIG